MKKKKVKKLKELLKKTQYRNEALRDINHELAMKSKKKSDKIISLVRLMPIDLGRLPPDDQLKAIGSVFSFNEMHDIKVNHLRAGTGAIKKLHELGAFTARNEVWGVPVQEVRTLRSMEIEVVSQDSLREDDVDNYRECILGAGA